MARISAIFLFILNNVQLYSAQLYQVLKRSVTGSSSLPLMYLRKEKKMVRNFEVGILIPVLNLKSLKTDTLFDNRKISIIMKKG